MNTHSANSKRAQAVQRAMIAAALMAFAGPAMAQGWSWPWEEQQAPRPRPREPMYRPEAQPPPPPAANWASPQGSICLRLEQRLVQETQRGAGARDALPQLDAEISDTERAYHAAQSQLDRKDCYDYFLFTKTLRRSRACVDLASQEENHRRRLSDLQAQRQNIIASSDGSYRDEIIRELARNNCGGNYAQEPRRRDRGGFSPFWDDGESDSWSGNQYGALPYATYRTLCVRLCDGYYFPVSFSTLPNHFERDDEICQNRCAAPSELYYYQNPGGSVDQMMSFRTQQPYATLQSAFKYRKELVQGCSCKEAEYNADGAPAAAPAEGGEPESADSAPEKRAEGPLAGPQQVNPNP